MTPSSQELPEEMEESAVVICPKCGAENIGEQRCWLCMEPMDASVSKPGVKPPIRIPAAVQPGAFSLSTVMLTITWLCVICGTLTIGPGLAIPLAILSVPVFIRTILIVQKRRELGLDVSPAKRTFLFLGSFATATVMLGVVGVAAVGTFCGVCFGVAVSGANESGAVIMGILGAGIVLILLVWGFTHWIRARWRRDTRR